MPVSKFTNNFSVYITLLPYTRPLTSDHGDVILVPLTLPCSTGTSCLGLGGFLLFAVIFSELV